MRRACSVGGLACLENSPQKPEYSRLSLPATLLTETASVVPYGDRDGGRADYVLRLAPILALDLRLSIANWLLCREAVARRAPNARRGSNGAARAWFSPGLVVHAMRDNRDHYIGLRPALRPQ
jgi:hypothetical protein